MDWIEETKELGESTSRKTFCLTWIEWAEMEENDQPLTDDIFPNDMVRKWEEEVQGERNTEPVFAIITPAIFRKFLLMMV